MEYRVIGVMSGTSLDAIDLAMCHFKKTDDNWSFELKAVYSEPISPALRTRLMKAIRLPALELQRLDNEIGILIGGALKRFISENNLQPHFIASHGHTVFHLPEEGITHQLGSGARITAMTGVPVVCDFRTVDVALGGQGAPLVPVGDHFLFSEYDFCLNLGGIANITCMQEGTLTAFDICPANIALNFLANEKKEDYDEDGTGARSGKVNEALLQKFNRLDFYQQDGPKSLGREWVEDHIFPLLVSSVRGTDNLLATLTQHIAQQVGAAIRKQAGPGKQQVLVTGGGAYNHYLVELIRKELPEGVQLVIPEAKIVEYKEALIFAFLGLLRVLNKPNCYRSVTGASKDNIGGAIYGNFPFTE